MISVRDFGPIGIYTLFGYQTVSMNIKIGENSKINTIKKHKKKNARKILPNNELLKDEDSESNHYFFVLAVLRNVNCWVTDNIWITLHLLLAACLLGSNIFLSTL